MTDVPKIRRAVEKLEASDTPLKRNRARRTFQGLVRMLLKRYPAMAKTGREIVRRGAVCVCPLPSCGIPLKTWTSAIKHFEQKHGAVLRRETRGVSRKVPGASPYAPASQRYTLRFEERLRCFGCAALVRGRAGLAKHLTGVAQKDGELLAHLVKAETEKHFKERMA